MGSDPDSLSGEPRRLRGWAGTAEGPPTAAAPASLFLLLSYFGTGENRERYFGVKIPPTNLKPDFLEQANAFANGLADGLEPSRALVG